MLPTLRNGPSVFVSFVCVTDTNASGGAGSRYQPNTSNRGGANISNRGGGAGSAANVGNDAAAKKKRKCGLCGQEGSIRFFSFIHSAVEHRKSVDVSE